MAEAFTAAERTMLTALATEVAAARLSRAEIMDSGNKGRVFMRVPGPETEAERKWNELMAPFAAAARARREAMVAAGHTGTGRWFS